MMNWIEVTPETMPPIKPGQMLSKKIWATVMDENTGEKTVVETVFAQRHAKKYWWGETVEDIYGFLCEYEHYEIKGDIYGGLKRRKGIKVTHWAEIDVPAPPDGDNPELLQG